MTNSALGYGATVIGLGLAALLWCQVLTQRLTQRMDRPRVPIAALICAVILAVGQASAESLGAVLLLGFLTGLSEGVALPVVAMLLVNGERPPGVDVRPATVLGSAQGDVAVRAPDQRGGVEVVAFPRVPGSR